ncbi:MAG: hypothetical protein ABI639_17515 [Thermoanaerobaculia bacterium]
MQQVYRAPDPGLGECRLWALDSDPLKDPAPPSPTLTEESPPVPSSDAAVRMSRQALSFRTLPRGSRLERRIAVRSGTGRGPVAGRLALEAVDENQLAAREEERAVDIELKRAARFILDESRDPGDAAVSARWVAVELASSA